MMMRSCLLVSGLSLILFGCGSSSGGSGDGHGVDILGGKKGGPQGEMSDNQICENSWQSLGSALYPYSLVRQKETVTKTNGSTEILYSGYQVLERSNDLIRLKALEEDKSVEVKYEKQSFIANCMRLQNEPKEDDHPEPSHEKTDTPDPQVTDLGVKDFVIEGKTFKTVGQKTTDGSYSKIEYVSTEYKGTATFRDQTFEFPLMVHKITKYDWETTTLELIEFKP